VRNIAFLLSQMRIKIFVRILAFVTLMAIVVLQFCAAIIAQSSYSGMNPSPAIRKFQQQPHLLVAYGRQALLDKGDLKGAEHWFIRALRSNPYYIPAWLGLSELRNDEGDSAGAEEILKYVNTLMNDVARWRWDKAMLAYLLGRKEMLTADLSWLLQHSGVSERTKLKVVKFALTLWPEPAQLVRKLGHQSIVPLFVHAVRLKKKGVAKALWPFYATSSPKISEILSYINLLIKNKELAEAGVIWHRYFSDDRLVYNGDFTETPINSGFGWRVRKVDGVLTGLPAKDNKSGLHLLFTGTANIRYAGVRQIIPVVPDQRYLLSGMMKSDHLTTNKRPYVEVGGMYCSMTKARTAMVNADQDWTPFGLRFTAPELCEGILLQIKRDESGDIDNLIQGDFWLNDLILTPLISHTQLNISKLDVMSKVPDRLNPSVSGSLPTETVK